MALDQQCLNAPKKEIQVFLLRAAAIDLTQHSCYVLPSLCIMWYGINK